MPEEINFYSRKEEYGWLSNFDRTPVRFGEHGTPDEHIYLTNEHFYQSQKAIDFATQWWIKTAPNPYLAMKAGRSLREKEIRPDWELIKVPIMLMGLRAKFKDKVLRQKLIDTGDAVLHEDSETDMFWGKKGMDMLGKLLMQVRDEINEENNK